MNIIHVYFILYDINTEVIWGWLVWTQIYVKAQKKKLA